MEWGTTWSDHLQMSKYVKTDASQRGWGAYSEGILTGGCCNETEVALHINTQDMFAASYGIKTLAKDRSHVHILLLSDNVIVVHLYQPPRRDKVKAPTSTSPLAIGSVAHHHHSSAPSWVGECTGRLHV